MKHSNQGSRAAWMPTAGGVVAALLFTTAPVVAIADDKTATSGGISYIDIAAGDGAGIDYRRVRSPRDAIFEAQKQQPLYTLSDVLDTPNKARGLPGVAVFDYDGDGDQDLYVSNGPGRANSLYQNQLQQTGQVYFIDVAVSAGIDASAHDSVGLCVGDTDNDGDDDVLVLGSGEPNLLFVNQGDGSFTEVSGESEIGGGTVHSATCSMGDFDGDGLLDIVIGNSHDWDNQLAIFAIPYAVNEHNQIFLNTGGNHFIDVSASSGIEDTSGFRPAADGSPTITWAIAAVDIDLDGDVDIVHADDQAAMLHFDVGGVDRGIIHVFENDGTGFFTDISADIGTNLQGQWMGLSFGDINCDGHMDIFGANLGDYMLELLVPPYQLGLSASRWLLGSAAGSFDDPGVGPELVASAFGWGNGMVDYDNDGDYDIIYHGGLDAGPFVEASNSGVVLQNHGCSASFTYDQAATSATDHQRRNVQGLALGDLDDNGFADVITVSNFDQPAPVPLVPYGVSYGSPFDNAAIVPTFIPTGNPGEFVWSGLELPDGTLSVELSSGDNGNHWVKVQAVGSRGVIADGRVNRGGIGAVVSFTPKSGPTSMHPVVVGASYTSTHSRESMFGLGAAKRGTVDVLWPGGVRNRLYNVRHGSRVTFPEIPCSFADDWERRADYKHCVRGALNQLHAAGAISKRERAKFLSSAMRAFADFRHAH